MISRFFLYIITGIFLVNLIPGAAGQSTVKQGNPVPTNFCISEQEMKLYRMVNDYRKAYDLPPISLSRSLCYVASLHVKDLFLYHSENSPCNLHSWSARGFWKPFCYPQDENKKNSVWDKPREITRYPSKGYEIVYWENSTPSPDSIMQTWTMEAYFNDFLMNTGNWENRKWNAFGIAIYENYASAWFGEGADPEGPAWVCGNPPAKKQPERLTQEQKTGTPAKTKADSLAKKGTTKKQGSKTDSIPKSQATGNTPAPGDSLQNSGPEITGKQTIAQDTLTVYYIIIRTNVSKTLADQIVQEQKSKGFQDAKVQMYKGKTRISIFETKDREVALSKLKEIRQTVKDAWLLKGR